MVPLAGMSFASLRSSAQGFASLDSRTILVRFRCRNYHKKYRPKGGLVYGAPSRNRTSTPLREADFESAASTSSAIGALKKR